MTQIYRYQEIYKDLLKILDIQFLLPGTCPFEIPHEGLERPNWKLEIKFMNWNIITLFFIFYSKVHIEI